MTMSTYLVKTILISGLLFAYFGLFLRNRLFHQFNRVFLLSIPLISFLLPLFNFNLLSLWNQPPSESPIRLLGVGRGTIEDAAAIYANQNKETILSWELIFTIISIVFSFLLLLRFISTLWFLHKLRNASASIHVPEATIYFVSEKGTPFSFFKSIFWNSEMDLSGTLGKQILKHEIFHVKHHHSVDIFLIEIITIVFWFNPFLLLIRRELKAIHEYGADEYAASGTDTFEYARLLVMNIAGSSLRLTNPFFQNQIKKRIAMITKNAKNKKNLANRLFALPLLIFLICLFSFRYNEHFSMQSSKPLRVIIDPGHGGVFPGVKSNGIYEKDINLSIAKKIQQLAKDYNIEVILTRDKDENIGGTDLKRSLEYRAGLAKKENASLFISIHLNGTDGNIPQDKYSGFQIYVSNDTGKLYESSIKLGSVVSNYIKKDFTIDPELKQRPERIRVLNHNSVPAILIECGYMDNETDLKYLQDEHEQKKIANDILQGIEKYFSQNTTYLNQSKNTGSRLPLIDTNIFQNPNKHLFEISDTGGIAKKVEVEAEFPHGQSAWYEYLSKNFKYPQEAINKEIQGTVMVKFIVKTDGSVANVEAIGGPETLKSESIRVIAHSGKWIPAKNRGVTVDSYKQQPLVYKLERKS